MTPQQQEIEKLREKIVEELRRVFDDNMTVFDWDIPENDEKVSAVMILDVMQDALDELKQEFLER